MSATGDILTLEDIMGGQWDEDLFAEALAGALSGMFSKESVEERLGSPGVGLSDLFIKDKNKSLIALVPNEVQTLLMNAILPRWNDPDVPIVDRFTPIGLREIYLKGRQFGISTLVLAIFFLDTVNHPHTSTVIIAHDADSTERMFNIVQRFYDNLPDHKKPRKKYANRREYVWSDLDSTFFVGTAGNLNFGRSNTINNILASEVPLWPDAAELVSGLMETVPEDGNIIVEATAKGIGNWYHSEWKKAEAGGSVFTPRFFSWTLHSEYRVRSISALERQRQVPLSEEEQVLTAKHGLTFPQVAWRRAKIALLGEKFKQEYPTIPDEAFLTTGSPYFDREALLRMAEVSPEPIEFSVPRRYEALAKQVNSLDVWKVPERGRAYLVSGDVAEGLKDWGDHDYSVADVWDMYRWEQVAQIRGQWSPEDFTDIMHWLAVWYNYALLAPESNNHGHTVLSRLIHHWNYPTMDSTHLGGVYYHTDYDRRAGKNISKPGYPTTVKTKYMALDGLASDLMYNEIIIRSKTTISELLTFVKLPGGKAGAEGNSHDDCVTSAAIGSAIMRLKHDGAFTPRSVGGRTVIQSKQTQEALEISADSPFLASAASHTDVERVDSTGFAAG